MARFDREQEIEKKNPENASRPSVEPEASGEAYSLEDILNEFGGWSDRAAEPAPAPESDPQPVEPEQTQMPAEQDEPEYTATPAPPEPLAGPAATADEPDELPRAPSRFQFINLDLNASTASGDDTPQEELWSWRGEPEAEAEQAQPKPVRENAPTSAPTEELPEHSEPTARPERVRKPRHVRRVPSKTEPEKRPPISPETALRYFRNHSAFLRLRAIFLLLLTLAAVFLTLAPLLPVTALQKLGSAKAVPAVLLILMCLSAVASLDIILHALTQLASLQFGLELLLTVSLAACVADSVGALFVPRVSYCAVVCVGFLYCAWSRYLTCVGNIRSLRVVAESEPHYSVKLARNAWNDLDCVYKTQEEIPDYVDLLEAPNRASKAMQLYVPLAVAASLVFSIVCNLRADAPLVQMLSACLCASIPVCGFVCYARPFARVASRLSRAGAALCGWSAARILGGDLGEIVCDSDLYPTSAVTINGVKVYHEFRLEQMLCYASSAIAMSESHLKPLFEKLAEEQGVRPAEIGSFRTYEGGGVGAEIRGDIVLVGSLGFMHLMGVRLPQGTNIRQAVYVAVNGVIAGVIAINYAPASPVVSALQSSVRRRGLSIVGATRDFLISPAMLHAKFHIPTTRAEFPPVADRYRLSSLSAGDAMETAAVLSRGTILPFSESILGARALKSAVTTGVGVNLFGGLFGLLVVFFLGIGCALETASAVNLLLFVLIWTVPGLLITSWANRF